MNRYAVIENNNVINVVLWDGQTDWEGANQSVLCDENVKIGDTYFEGVFMAAEDE